MRRFVQLFHELDRTTRTIDKVAALTAYFREAEPTDGAYALYVLTGNKLLRSFNTRPLRGWAAQEAGLPEWLVGECYEAVGDLSEALALLLPDSARKCRDDEPLHRVIQERVLPLAVVDDEARRAMVVDAWASLSRDERLLYHKLIWREFRIGAAKKLVIQGAAAAAGIDPAVMEHRLMGQWQPEPETYLRLMNPDETAHDPGRPYPFCLAYALEGDPDSLGEVADWRAEWKWDGIRAQLLRRHEQTMLWSRGEELITEGFPELTALGDALPEGTVLDGEVLAFERDRPLPFGELQKRINRKNVQPTLFAADVPVVFMAYDLLEREGEDVRERPLVERRAMLETVAGGLRDEPHFLLSQPLWAANWEELAAMQGAARERGVEGLMLKRADSPYRVGRVRGDWWKWKVDPHAVDAVLVYAQRGHGRRSSKFTDYTFAVWDRRGEKGCAEGRELVPVAKAYSGLTDEEIIEVDRYIRGNTIKKRGPICEVTPHLVMELHFEGIRESNRHNAGVALRFPRMGRWRRDKTAQDADTLEDLQALLKSWNHR